MISALSRRHGGIRVGVLGLGLLLSACAVQLAPAYDKTLADGLVAASADAMSLMSTASAGTSPTDFASRSPRYDAVIGKLDALAIEAGARPAPKTRVGDVVNKLLEKRGTPPVNDDDPQPPSVHAIGKVSETVAKMRDTDHRQGLTATEVALFKGQAAIYFDQAITYENFLQR